MADQTLSDRTMAIAATPMPSLPAPTRTIEDLLRETSSIADEAGFVRSQGELIARDATETGRRAGQIQHRAIEHKLNIAARIAAGTSAADLLEALASDGFAWRDVARLVGVSVPAVRRWRQGEPPSANNRLAIARLVAFVDILRKDHFINAPANWMEMPLAPERAPATGIDLVADGRYADLVDLAEGHVSGEEILDRWKPDWREEYRSDFEVFEAADGELAIRQSSPERA